MLALRNSFISFSTSREALRARAPAALFPLSTCASASLAKVS
ncbi:secreted protein [gut metagenome]|uniref:Secreted protein n=1 Tax=gut metagenome TaxID=749906 RepID=J9GZF1_9ZZZZ